AVTGMLMFGAASTILAQEENLETPETTVVETDTTVVDAPVTVETTEAEVEMTIHKQLKTKFIEGGAEFMGVILLTLILGLALSIERI
ncbi:MAG TPA: flagellar motor protein MotA, partial [Bacteroidales bacterium]|nr:flagellar motor protein MotA [Bacteroidales bacterium]